MATRSEKMRAGAFLGGAILVLIGILTFTGYLQLKEEGTNYHSLFQEVSNLSEGAPVKFKGVTIGEVTDITFSKDGTSPRIRVKFRIKKKRLITHHTIARLGVLSPLSGRQYVRLTPKDDVPTTEKNQPLPPGSQIPSQTSEIQETFATIRETLNQMNELLEANRKRFTQLLQNSNRMLEDVHTLFSGKKRPETIKEGSLLHLTQEIDRAVGELTKTAQTLRQTVNESRPTITNTAKSIQTTAEKLQSSATEIEKSAQQIRSRITSQQFQNVMNNVENVAANSANLTEKLEKISTDVESGMKKHRPAFRSTFKDLQRTIKNLEALSSKLERSPSSLIRSNSQPKRKISE